MPALHNAPMHYIGYLIAQMLMQNVSFHYYMHLCEFFVNDNNRADILTRTPFKQHHGGEMKMGSKAAFSTYPGIDIHSKRTNEQQSVKILLENLDDQRILFWEQHGEQLLAYQRADTLQSHRLLCPSVGHEPRF